MLRIRLRRMGSRHRPFYRLVVSDSRRTPTARALDEVGFYDPRKAPGGLQINLSRVDHWMSLGANPSQAVAKLIGQVRAGKVAAADGTGAAAAEPAAAEPAAAETAAAEPEAAAPEAAEPEAAETATPAAETAAEATAETAEPTAAAEA